MSNITANLVKELREKTSAGMMDCKKALVEMNGDFDAAVDWLRKKGHASAAKRSDRVASEGLVALSVREKQGVIIELNSETDFVARNEKFQALLNELVNMAYDIPSIEELLSSNYSSSGRTVEEEITENAAVIGEKISLRRLDKLSVDEGVVGSYVHNEVYKNAGKIGVLVSLESNADVQKLNSLAKQIAMHIAASNPEVLNIEDVNAVNLKKEKDIFREQFKLSGKPDNIIDKMMEGRVKKYYQESVLVEQAFVIDNKTPIKDILANFAKENNAPVKITRFIRYSLGEGIKE